MINRVVFFVVLAALCSSTEGDEGSSVYDLRHRAVRPKSMKVKKPDNRCKTSKKNTKESKSQKGVCVDDHDDDVTLCVGAPVGSSCSLGGVDASIVSNPSFENNTGCPTEFSQMSLAIDWNQATAGTSDYWVKSTECIAAAGSGSYGTALQGFPDAFDGISFVGTIGNANGYYEYVGTCLVDGGMKNGIQYTFTLALTAGVVTGNYGGATDGRTELLCVPSCDEFQISGSGYKGDDYTVLATALPDGGLQLNGEWKTITFVTTPTEDCPAIMIGPAKDQTVSEGYDGTYIIFDLLNLQEGPPGVCNAEGECVPQ